VSRTHTFIISVTEDGIIIGVEHQSADSYTRVVRPAAHRLAKRCAGIDKFRYVQEAYITKRDYMGVVTKAPCLTVVVYSTSFDQAALVRDAVQDDILRKFPEYRKS
jgi:hypothetical protein